MSLWTNVDESAGAPVYKPVAGVDKTGTELYGNTQVDVFVTGVELGVFGVDATEAVVTTGDGQKIQHAGWNLRKQGTGPVVSITANTGATSPDGNVYITFTGGGTGNTSANAQVFVNSVSSVITTIVVNNPGSYSTTPTVAAVNSNAIFTVTMGGRANRTQYETLVAMGSMTGDGSDDTIFPDS